MTAIEQIIDNLKCHSRTAAKKVAWLTQFAPEIEEVPSYVSEDTVLFSYISHGQVIQIIKALGGKWTKTPNELRFDYKRIEPLVNGQMVEIRAGSPPATCKIVTEKVYVPEALVPAHYEEKRKVQCPHGTTDTGEVSDEELQAAQADAASAQIEASVEEVKI